MVSRVTQQKRFSSPMLWFALAWIVSSLLLLLTGVYATGLLTMSVLRVEQWLLLRPITRLDCIFYEWRYLGEFVVSLLLTSLLAGCCILMGYHKRVLFFLLCLLLLGGAGEVLGKTLFEIPVPVTLHSGMAVLACPQIHGQSVPTRLAVGMGMWWAVPTAPLAQVRWAHAVVQMPLDAEHTTDESGYPSGHALRWCYLGLVACWLVRRHGRKHFLASYAVLLTLVIAFGGGFMQFYIGVHVVTDVLAGYLLGSALACAAIGLLLMSGKKKPA